MKFHFLIKKNLHKTWIGLVSEKTKLLVLYKIMYSNKHWIKYLIWRGRWEARCQGPKASSKVCVKRVSSGELVIHHSLLPGARALVPEADAQICWVRTYNQEATKGPSISCRDERPGEMDRDLAQRGQAWTLPGLIRAQGGQQASSPLSAEAGREESQGWQAGSFEGLGIR